MRRVLALPLIAVALLIPAGLATAALDDANGPACTDITDVDFFYNGVPTDAASGTEATVIIHLDTASCQSVTYTLVVLDSLADPREVTRASLRGDGDSVNPETGEDTVTVAATIPTLDRDGEVCLYATTSVGRRVFDRAPDANLSPNCVELIPGGTGGGGGFN